MGETRLTRHLFVYGTLKRASRHPMARRLARESVWLGRASMNGRLYLPGAYPGAVPSPRCGDIVHGEVVRLHNAETTLAWLDDYEGCGTKCPERAPYHRDNVTVHMVPGGTRQVWVYLYDWRIWCTRLLPHGHFPAG